MFTAYFYESYWSKIIKTLTRMVFCKKKSQLEYPDVVGLVKIECGSRELYLQCQDFET